MMSLLPTSPLSGSQRICHRHTRFSLTRVEGVSTCHIHLPHVDYQVLRWRGSGKKKKKTEAASLSSSPGTPIYPRSYRHLHLPRQLGSLQVRAKDDWRVGVAIFPARSASGDLRVGGASGCELGLCGSVVRVAPGDTMQQK